MMASDKDIVVPAKAEARFRFSVDTAAGVSELAKTRLPNAAPSDSEPTTAPALAPKPALFTSKFCE